MKLQGRNLSIEMQGEDVKLLHSELKMLDLLIADDELNKSFFGGTTREAVMKFQKNSGMEPTCIVDKSTALAINARVDLIRPRFVRGQIKHPDGADAAGVLVRAYDKDMRSEEPLGKPTTTDKEGRYEITYSADEFSRAEKLTADLIVRVSNQDGVELISSNVTFNAGDNETVDLTMPGEYQEPSEYEKLIKELEPVLQGVPLQELTEEDITFLANDTGIERQRIVWLREGAKREEETKFVDPDIHTHVAYRIISAAVFYGWSRQNLPAELDGLLNQSEDALRRAFVASLRSNIIPAQLQELKDRIFAQWGAVRLLHMLKPAPEGKHASLGDLLNTMPTLLDRGKQYILAEAFVKRQVPDEELWKTIEAKGFTQTEIMQVQNTLKLGELTQNHLPLLYALQRMGQEDPELNELRGFTKLELADWVDIISRPQENGQPIGFPQDTPGEDESARITAYAAVLNTFIEKIFPTAVIAHWLDKDNLEDSPLKEAKDDFKTFFANNPAFEFGAIPVDVYLSKDRDQRLKGIKQAEELTSQLKNIQ